MATSIHNVLAVNIQGIDSGTAAGSRTFTTTRALRMFDTIWRKDSTAVGAAAAALTVSNAGNVCHTTTTPNPPVINTVYRAGGENGAGARLVSTCDDAQMLVAAGGTIVFAVSTADDFDATVLCITE